MHLHIELASVAITYTNFESLCHSWGEEQLYNKGYFNYVIC